MSGIEAVGMIILYPVFCMVGYVLAPVFYVVTGITLALVILPGIWIKDWWGNRRYQRRK